MPVHWHHGVRMTRSEGWRKSGSGWYASALAPGTRLTRQQRRMVRRVSGEALRVDGWVDNETSSALGNFHQSDLPPRANKAPRCA